MVPVGINNCGIVVAPGIVGYNWDAAVSESGTFVVGVCGSDVTLLKFILESVHLVFVGNC